MQCGRMGIAHASKHAEVRLRRALSETPLSAPAQQGANEATAVLARRHLRQRAKTCSVHESPPLRVRSWWQRRTCLLYTSPSPRD
eukprot:15435469-Alexandrium_andersonii.AAC.1